MTTTQIRPFSVKRVSDRGVRVDILGGFIRYREDEHFKRFNIYPIAFYTARKEPQHLRSWFMAVWPFLLLGSDDFLLLPFGGVTRGFLGIDEMLMITPFYIRSRWHRKHPTDPTTYTAHNILWPFIAWGSDGKPGGRRKFRVVPFYGRSRAENGEARGFVLWPFYTWRRKSEADKGFFAFPFYGRDETPTRRSTTVLFPLYHRNENLLTGATDTALWPFWRRAKGTDAREVHRYWPAVEYRRAGWNTTHYYGWPFYRREYIDGVREFGRITSVPPFYKRVVRVSKKDLRVHRKTLVWPFTRVDRYMDGGREVLVPKLIPYDHPRLREYTAPLRPFFAIWHRRVYGNGDRDTSAAFGILIAKRRGDNRKVRILGGLVGWDRTEKGRYLRLLWGLRLRLGDSR